MDSFEKEDLVFKKSILKYFSFSVGIIYMVGGSLRHIALPLNLYQILLIGSSSAFMISIYAAIKYKLLKFRYLSHIFLWIFTSSIVSFGIYGLGFLIPVLSILILLPISSIFLLGKKNGAPYSILSIICFFILYYLDFSNPNYKMPVTIEELFRAKFIIFSAVTFLALLEFLRKSKYRFSSSTMVI